MNKSIVGGLLAIGYMAQAQATSLNAVEVLQQFNLVVLENDSSYSHVDGRTWVGGDLTGRGDYVQHPNTTPASAYAGLTVMGNASGANVNGLGASIAGNLNDSNINSGPATVGGNATGVNFNGPTAAVGGTVSNVNFNATRLTGGAAQAALDAADAQASSTNFADVTRTASQQLSGVSDTDSTVTINGNKAIFNAVVVDGVAVFDLTGIDDLLFGDATHSPVGEFEFNRNNATSMIFNVDNRDITVAANFLGGSAQEIASYALWNFSAAQNLTIYGQFGGSILAPWATLTNYNNLEGSVVVRSLNQYGEIHQGGYGGHLPPPPPPTPVPLPGALGLMFSALGLFAGVRLRKG